MLSYVGKAGKARHAVIESGGGGCGGGGGGGGAGAGAVGADGAGASALTYHVGGKAFGSFGDCWASVRQVAKHGLRFRLRARGGAGAGAAAAYELEPGQSARAKVGDPADPPASPFVGS